MNRLDEWLAAAAAELGVEHPVDSRLLLDMTRDVAHGVERPAAPLTAYLLGLAVARGANPSEACARLSALAATWTAAPAIGAPATAAPATSAPATSGPATRAPAAPPPAGP